MNLKKRRASKILTNNEEGEEYLRIMKKTISNILIALLLGMVSVESSPAFAVMPPSRQKKADAEQLAKALDYFKSQKYHECLLLLQPLDKRYKLNPRYRAYLGLCHYYEWEYEEAILCFDDALPKLEGFAPAERSIYYWTDAESHFSLQRYAEAIPLYEKMLSLCHDNERPDAYFRLGFCHLFLSEKEKARECFEQSLAGYLKYRNTSDEKARIAQIRHIIGGLKGEK